MGTFSLSFNKFKNKSVKQMDAIIRKTALELTSNIILDTPVDTGRARGAWLVSIDRENISKTDIQDKSGITTISKAESSLNNPIGRFIYIQNNLDYIVGLEYGKSKQAPNGMVRKNIIRFSKYLEESARTQI